MLKLVLLFLLAVVVVAVVKISLVYMINYM